MDYKNIYFRIKAGYKWGEGMDDEQKADFFTEIQSLFHTAGWSVEKRDSTGSCPSVYKGLSRLYCHPMNISGEVSESLIEQIKDILKNGTTFEHYHTDEYDTIYDMTDEAYQSYLNNNSEQIQAEILKAFTTKRSNLYYDEYNSGRVLQSVGGKWHIHRIQNGENWRRANDLESKVINSIFEDMVSNGTIATSSVKNGKGYRTAKKAA